VLEAGDSLDGFRLVERVGAGSTGTVWQARDPRDDRVVALRVLAPEFVGDPERLARLEHDVRALRKLSHPSIATIEGVREFAGTTFVTMQFAPGERLSDCIPPNGLPLVELREISLALTDAIGAAHRRGVTHGNLKPANIRIGEDGRPRILDFGLAECRGREVETDRAATATVTQEILMDDGFYLAPEQIRGAPLDPRTDIFAVGVLVYEMATGRHPFYGESAADVLVSILRDRPQAATEIRPELPRRIDTILNHSLVKDRERRLQSAQGIRDVLAHLH